MKNLSPALSLPHYISYFNNAIPFSNEENFEDTEYIPSWIQLSLLQYWKRNQRQLQLFSKEWTKGYLLSLRETLPLVHKGPRSRVH